MAIIKLPWLENLPLTQQALQSVFSLEPAQRLTKLNEFAAQAAPNLRNAVNLPLRFVAQSELPASVAYESFIFETGCVPTRIDTHWSHDFFNALTWLQFPQTKAELNAAQARAISANGTTARSKDRDAITIFDENALILQAPPNIAALIKTRQWQKALLENASAWRGALRDAKPQCVAHCFGHALLDKLRAPYKAITAHVWLIETTENAHPLGLAQLDAVVAQQLRGQASPKVVQPFYHLPVLGIPDWWAGQDAAFYADAAVFRN